MLAQGALIQSEAVDELRLALDRMSTDAKENAKMAISAQYDTQKTSEQIEKSDRDMEEMVAAMNDISNAAYSIGNIIKAIETIAFQTNILALNAAVEAARAGTAGKGFAVVASEVRNLASQSDRAAKATKELIMNSIEAVKRGNAIVSNVSDVLKKTLEFSNQSAEGMDKITKAVQGESKIIEKTAAGINRIAEVVHTNSATSQETAAASEQMFTQSRQLQEHTAAFILRKDIKINER
ncbi:methyl-accepting chemotaxis protein [Candidatus Agathobaculum pullicola]|uniref:methyl-accepting chemotaxis protein n=1 Tax=Candidatus Agathobaculum pullicola TaxID=2838426 RepID=UPI003F938933